MCVNEMRKKRVRKKPSARRADEKQDHGHATTTEIYDRQTVKNKRERKIFILRVENSSVLLLRIT